MIEEDYTIYRDFSESWWEFPYKVRCLGNIVGLACTLRGAKRIVAKDARENTRRLKMITNPDSVKQVWP